MRVYRKIKIFKFSEFESYQDCEEAVNDYVSEMYNDFKCFPQLDFNSDYITVICPDLNLAFNNIPKTTQEQRQIKS